MQAIVATDMCWGIGNEGKLLFHIPEDMAFFKQKTIGKVVVMGRKTFETLPNGEPLKDRINLVLTTQEEYESPQLYKGPKDKIDRMIENLESDEVFIIGGQSVYEWYLQKCDKVYRTVLNVVLESDRKFPILSESGFKFNSLIKDGLYKGSKWYIEEWVKK